nr:hypothetical protein CFP56_05588 [Quercus suber]
MGRSVVGGFELWVMAVGGLSFMGCGLWRWVNRLVVGKSVVGYGGGRIVYQEYPWSLWVFFVVGLGNTFLFVTSLLLILRRQIWRKSLILGEKCQSNNLDLLSAGKGETYVPGHYERNQSCPAGRSTSETRKRGRNATSSVEEGSADVVHRKVSSVTTHEVTSSLLLPTAMQLFIASTPTIIEELVLHKSPFVAEINNNDELLLARTIVPDMKSNNQLAQNLKCNAINSPAKVKIFLPPSMQSEAN